MTADAEREQGRGPTDVDLERLADGALLERARDGSEAAFRELYGRHRRATFAFLFALLGDRALAEDALQETFVRLFQSRERLDGGRPFRPWLFQVARNLAVDAIRVRAKAGRLEAATARPEAEGAEPAADTAERREEAGRTRAALASLPPEPRALLVQRHTFGMTLPELARSWSVSERTISTRLREAATLLARALRPGREGRPS